MSTQTQTTNITVRSTNGTYLTNSIKGVKASCTGGASQAAERMGQKLFGESFLRVEPIEGLSTDHNLTHWRLHAEPVHAWAWSSGLIEFGKVVPEDALKFATGIDPKLRELVGVRARHGYGKSTGKLLVPGVPEKTSESKKMDAFIAWVEWCSTYNGKPSSGGVVFSRG